MRKAKEIQKNEKFGRLTVKYLHHKERKNDGRIKHYYLCKCSCGKEVLVEKWNLLTGHSKSCGCRKQEGLNKKSLGKSGERIYHIWANIKQRCCNKNQKLYRLYGARGIKMCSEWKESFVKFYEWAISNGYSIELTIDRIDTNGNYCPQNCRWTTMKEQNRNRRNNKIISFCGEEHCVAEWAEIKKIKPSTLYNRFLCGWSAEKALK